MLFFENFFCLLRFSISRAANFRRGENTRLANREEPLPASEHECVGGLVSVSMSSGSEGAGLFSREAAIYSFTEEKSHRRCSRCNRFTLFLPVRPSAAMYAS